MKLLIAATLFILACTPFPWSNVQIISYINNARSDVGVSGLQADITLEKVAQVRANTLAQTGILSHNAPDGCNAFCLMQRLGLSSEWEGENIGWNNYSDITSSTAAMMQAWINSPEHYSNIVNCHYTKIGEAVARSSDGKYWYATEFWGDRNC